MDCGAESHAEPLADADDLESDYLQGISQEDAAEVSQRPGIRV